MDRLLTELPVVESAVWEALVKVDTRAYRAALAEGFEGVSPDGFFGRDRQLAVLADGATVEDYALTEPRARAVGADHGLPSCHARYRRSRRDAWEAMRLSSLWRRRGDGWVSLLSQDMPDGAGVP